MSHPAKSREEKLNVYDATAEAYVTDAKLDEFTIKASPYHSLRNKSSYKGAFLDPYAPDYLDVFVEKGTVTAPDELLYAKRPLPLKIPVKLRDEFEHEDDLPASELLQAIQYYASSSGIPEHTYDETALLALGLMVELWITDELSDLDPLLFMEPNESIDSLRYAPEDLDDNGCSLTGKRASGKRIWKATENIASSSEESDILSLELLESDTASEVEGGRYPKRRKILDKMVNTTSGGDNITGSSSSDLSGGSSGSEISDYDDSESSEGTESGSDINSIPPSANGKSKTSTDCYSKSGADYKNNQSDSDSSEEVRDEITALKKANNDLLLGSGDSSDSGDTDSEGTDDSLLDQRKVENAPKGVSLEKQKQVEERNEVLVQNSDEDNEKEIEKKTEKGSDTENHQDSEEATTETEESSE